MRVELVAINTIQEKPTLLIQIDQQQQLYKVFDIQQMAKQATCVPHQPGAIKIGPWGGVIQDDWDFPGTNCSITNIDINHSEIINSVKIYYLDGATKTSDWKKFGGAGGVPDPIPSGSGSGSGRFASDEYITGISGTTIITTSDGRRVVESLTIKTNKKNYGPYGKTTGLEFDIPTTNGKVVGFFGNKSDFINAIGIYVIPVN